MADWFSQHAPQAPTGAPSGKGDWFASNSPAAAPVAPQAGIKPPSSTTDTVWQGVKDTLNGLWNTVSGKGPREEIHGHVDKGEYGAALGSILKYSVGPGYEMIVAPAVQQLGQAVQYAKAGRPVEAAGHALAGIVPVVGPMAAQLTETAVGEPTMPPSSQVGEARQPEPYRAGGQLATQAALAAAGAKVPALAEMAPEVVAATGGAVKSAARAAVSPQTMVGAGTAEYLASHVGLPHGVGAATVAIPRIVGAAIRGAKGVLAERAAMAPEAVEAAAQAAEHSALLDQVSQSLNGKSFKDLTPPEQTMVANIADKVKTSAQGEDRLPSAKAPVPLPEITTPHKTMMQLVDEDLASRRAATVSSEPSAVVPPAVVSLASPPAPPANIGGLMNQAGVNVPLRPPLRTVQPVPSIAAAPVESPAPVTIGKLMASTDKPWAAAPPEALSSSEDMEATGLQIPQLVKNRASVASRIAEHLNKAGITSEAIDALEADPAKWKLFWDQTGAIPGASKQRNYTPSEATIDSVRDILPTLSSKNVSSKTVQNEPGSLTNNPRALALAQQLASELGSVGDIMKSNTIRRGTEGNQTPQIVWRVEKAGGEGLGVEHKEYFEGMNTPAEDFSAKTMAQFPAPKYAFPDRETLKAWVKRENWPELSREGYRAVPYRVTNYATGRSGEQVMFQ